MMPEKEWFTLDEIAARWHCTPNYLLHIAGNDHLELGVYADGWEIFSNETSVKEHYQGFIRLLPLDLACLEKAERKLVVGGVVDWGGIKEVVAVGPGRNSAFRGERFEFLPLVHRSDLRVRRAERDRFEKEHRVGAHAGKAPPADSLDGRERTTLLQMIRVMDRKLPLNDAPKTAAKELQRYAARFGYAIRGKPEILAQKIQEARDLQD